MARQASFVSIEELMLVPNSLKWQLVASTFLSMADAHRRDVDRWDESMKQWKSREAIREIVVQFIPGVASTQLHSGMEWLSNNAKPQLPNLVPILRGDGMGALVKQGHDVLSGASQFVAATRTMQLLSMFGEEQELQDADRKLFLKDLLRCVVSGPETQARSKGSRAAQSAKSAARSGSRGKRTQTRR